MLDSRVGVTSAAPVISDDGALRLLSTSGGNLRDAALGFCDYAVKTLEVRCHHAGFNLGLDV